LIEPSSLLRAFRPSARRGRYSSLHPATKVSVFLILLSTPLLVRTPLGLLLDIILIAPLIVASKAVEEAANAVRGSILLLIAIVGLNYVFSRDIWLSSAMGMRLISMLMLSSSFFASTDVVEVGDLMEELGIPQHISFSLVMALRFVPVIARDAENIAAAQQSRGMEMRGGFTSRIKGLMPFLTTLVVTAIRRSQQLAEALESRAFGSGRRTIYKEYRFSWWDVAALSYAISSTALLILARRIWNL